ncbi:hypothetical protein [Mycobacterium sp. 1423905.2]|jgi:hypothetical protein|uniref:hypothetical protein n=1 Tax=Mycobacterium sp. 1423905.2 TaxID=1856859 RepID=UPI0007FEDB1D|nr:hypothetical protein [Mycobacterium sp. 1423905.2]OBJ47059.1 hypothetical protein A9W95_07485 [Mycobacterium sp. 1423905.2]
MADESWTVQTGEVDDPSNPGVPPVPTTVYDGDEAGARSAYDEHTAKATEKNYRYVLLRRVAEIIECWGTPPAVG